MKADRLRRIADVEQYSIARARAGCQADFGIHGNVVALVGLPRRLHSRFTFALLGETGDGAALHVREDARAIHDARLVR
jgi:hypothetical protein